MPASTIDRHRLPAPGDRIQHRPFRVQLLAQLIEPGDFQLGSQPNLPHIRRQSPDQQIQQGRFTGTVRADQADTVAAHHTQGKVTDQRFTLPRVTDLLRLNHQLPGGFRLLQFQAGLAGLLPTLAMLLAQRQ